MENDECSTITHLIGCVISSGELTSFIYFSCSSLDEFTINLDCDFFRVDLLKQPEFYCALFFAERIINICNSLDEESVYTVSVNTFRPSCRRCTLMGHILDYSTLEWHCGLNQRLGKAQTGKIFNGFNFSEDGRTFPISADLLLQMYRR